MAGIALDNVSNSTDNNFNVTSFSWNHTVNTVNNTVIIVGVSTRNTGANEFIVSGITYGGYACTKIRADNFFASSSKSSLAFSVSSSTFLL